MWLFQIVLISISLSVDALGIGVSYKMKGIRFPWYIVLWIGGINAFVMWLSLRIGGWLMEYFPLDIARILGGAVLIWMGTVFLRKSIYGRENTSYDKDGSRDINLWEGLLLGAALSADSISAGLALCGLRFSAVAAPIGVGIAQSLFLSAGIGIGQIPCLNKKLDQKKSGIFSGLLLVLMGLVRIV